MEEEPVAFCYCDFDCKTVLSWVQDDWLRITGVAFDERVPVQLFCVTIPDWEQVKAGAQLLPQDGDLGDLSPSAFIHQFQAGPLNQTYWINVGATLWSMLTSGRKPGMTL